MPLLTRYSIQDTSPRGTALYLAYFAGGIFEWTTDDEQAWEYEDREEAEADAEAHGGEVVEYDRPPRRHERPSIPDAFVAPVITLTPYAQAAE